MSLTNIDGLALPTLPLAGAELMEMEQNGINCQVPVSALPNFVPGALTAAQLRMQYPNGAATGQVVYTADSGAQVWTGSAWAGGIRQSLLRTGIKVIHSQAGTMSNNGAFTLPVAISGSFSSGGPAFIYMGP